MTQRAKEMLELADYLKEHSDRLTRCLERQDWKPTRSHIEGDRNTLVSAENTARQIAIRLAAQADAPEGLDAATVAEIIDPRAFVVPNSKRFDIKARQREALDKANAIIALASGNRP